MLKRKYKEVNSSLAQIVLSYMSSLYHVRILKKKGGGTTMMVVDILLKGMKRE